MDVPRIFTICESAHRIHNPFTPEKYATLGAVLRMAPGTRVLDFSSGSREMLCTWGQFITALPASTWPVIQCTNKAAS